MLPTWLWNGISVKCWCDPKRREKIMCEVFCFVLFIVFAARSHNREHPNMNKIRETSYVCLNQIEQRNANIEMHRINRIRYRWKHEWIIILEILRWKIERERHNGNDTRYEWNMVKCPYQVWILISSLDWCNFHCWFYIYLCRMSAILLLISNDNGTNSKSYFVFDRSQITWTHTHIPNKKMHQQSKWTTNAFLNTNIHFTLAWITIA